MSKDKFGTTKLLEKYKIDKPAIAPREARQHLREKDYSAFEKKELERIANLGYEGKNKSGCTIL